MFSLWEAALPIWPPPSWPRRKGRCVCSVADGARPPIDKACGEGLLPETVASLSAMGVKFGPGQAVSLCGIRFLGAKHRLSVEAMFPRCSGVAVRRTDLHATLLQHATEAGVSFAWGARVTGLSAEGVLCDGATIRSRWIVGADGEASQVRKWMFPNPPRHEQIRFGFRRHFQLAPWTDFVEVHWGDTCQITVTPVAAEEICLAVTSRNPRMKYQNALREIPELAERMAGAAAAAAGSAAPPPLCGVCGRCADADVRWWATHRARSIPSRARDWGWPFPPRQAEALTEALRRTRSEFPTRPRMPASARSRALMSRLLLLMDAHPWFRETSYCAAGDRSPQLFSRILNIHIQALPPSRLLARATRFGWDGDS